jgi:hypothetical protein
MTIRLVAKYVTRATPSRGFAISSFNTGGVKKKSRHKAAMVETIADDTNPPDGDCNTTVSR